MPDLPAWQIAAIERRRKEAQAQERVVDLVEIYERSARGEIVRTWESDEEDDEL